MIKKFENWLKDNSITEVECLVPDLGGIARGKILPSNKFIKGLKDDSHRLPQSIFIQTISGGYATEDDDPGTAPGQLPVSRMINGFYAKNISFKTIPIAVLHYGERAEWLSVRLNSLFHQKRLDAVALPVDSSSHDEHLISSMVDYGFKGFWEPEVQLWTLGETSIKEQSVVDPEEAARIFSNTLAESANQTIG